jgi:hypothetical protein
MAEETLTVHFRGICTHFHGVVPGIPHRTVLPDASAARTGTIRIGDKPVKPYTIHPHFPLISTSSKQIIDVEGLINEGKIIKGVRLEIVNVLDEALSYKERYKQVPPLTKYVSNYVPSMDVVYGGRALCYFDFFAGLVSSEKKHGERHATIRVRTDGPPILQVTPLVVESPVSPAPICRLTLESEELTFKNISHSCGEKSSKYDFLLNYLTAQAGIPHSVTLDFPVKEMRPDCDEAELPMCSDTRYP